MSVSQFIHHFRNLYRASFVALKSLGKMQTSGTHPQSPASVALGRGWEYALSTHLPITWLLFEGETDHYVQTSPYSHHEANPGV